MARGRTKTTSQTFLCVCDLCDLPSERKWMITFMGKSLCADCCGKLYKLFMTGGFEDE